MWHFLMLERKNQTEVTQTYAFNHNPSKAMYDKYDRSPV